MERKSKSKAISSFSDDTQIEKKRKEKKRKEKKRKERKKGTKNDL